MIKKTESDEKYNMRVIKSDSGIFFVDNGDEVIRCRARSKMKRDAVIVGDLVSLDCSGGEPVIDGASPRKNRLIRPSVANIDQIIIMVAAVPSIDYMLIDKLIINARRENIEAVICFNKSDVGMTDYPQIVSQYGCSVSKIINCCAIKNEVGSIRELLKDKLTCIAGQSAVGKSTLVNVLLGDGSQRTGELSRKINRGKNTTTSSEIFRVDGGYIMDTPGFGVIDVQALAPEEIESFYSEFDLFRDKCKFATCTHTAEPSCAVRLGAEQGEIDKNRYQRYLKIYSESKDFFENNRELFSKKTSKEEKNNNRRKS